MNVPPGENLLHFFSNYSTMAETSPYCVTSAKSNLESYDSKTILLLNFGGIFNKDRSHRACQKYVTVIF